MSITTYTELKTSVADWLHMNELTALIPDFITLAEASLNRKLRARVFETNATSTATIGLRTIPLPGDYLEPRALWLTTWQPRKELSYKTPETMDVDTSYNGPPEQWAIDGANIAFDVAADQAHTFMFRYRQKFALSTTIQTNWLLTNHPDVYLFGALSASAVYVRDNVQLGIWKQAFDLAFDEVQTQEDKHNQLATLSTDFGGRRANIYEG